MNGKEELALIQDINYYTRLGVSKDADVNEIKQAYQDIANEYLQIKYHPDEKKQNNMVYVDGIGKIDFASITEAYEVLQDSAKRKKYDLAFMEIPVWEERPNKLQDKPVDINVVMNLNSWHIKNLDGHEHFVAKITIMLKWHDPRLANWNRNKRVPKNIWKPEFYSVPFEIDPERKHQPPTLFDRNANDDLLMWEIPIKPLKWNLDDDFHRLLNFPYDSIRLDGFFCLSNELRLENRNDIRMHFKSKDKNGVDQHIFLSQTPERGEFILEGLSYGLGNHASPNIKNQEYDDVVISFHLRRNPTFYIYKAQLPTIITVLISLLTFIYDGADLGDRMETVLGMFLTSFAIQWTVMERLPPTPYLNNIDISLNSALFAMFLIVILHCISYTMSKTDVIASAAFDNIGCISVFVIYLFLQIYIYRRIILLSKKTGKNRLFKEGNLFYNKMIKLKNDSLFYRSLGYQEISYKTSSGKEMLNKIGGGRYSVKPSESRAVSRTEENF